MPTVNKPQLKTITAFDANKGCSMFCTWSSVFAATGCTIYFYEHSNPTVVHSSLSISGTVGKINLASSQLATANILNGHKYYASVTISYRDTTATPISTKATPQSDKVLFRCEQTPVFMIQSPTNGTTIHNTNFPIQILYAHENGIMIDQYIVHVYQGGNEVFNSGIIHGNDLLFSTNEEYAHYVVLTYNLTSLPSNTSYTIDVEGYLASDSLISNGMSVKTSDPFISGAGGNGAAIAVAMLTNNPEYSPMQLENDYYHGCINISSDVSIIDGVSFKYLAEDPNISYVNESEVDLTEEGRYVSYSGGYGFSGDFIAFFNGHDFDANTPVVEMSTGASLLSVSYVPRYKHIPDSLQLGFTSEIDTSLQACFCMTVSGESQNYTCCSNYFDALAANQIANVTIKKIENMFSIQAVIEEVTV